ncbi:carbohydrate kinase family protein [Candidatus Roizmanbacteria bacterium]|nr:carbohydrate kinase family protein [Candidatus Roizmanbacteria bacterium]
MYHLISIGNITIDLFFKGDSLTYHDGRFQLCAGGKYVADFFQEGVGGGGANVAIGAAKHGLMTGLMGIIGDTPFKPLILEKLRGVKVKPLLCRYDEKFMSISTILLNHRGERSVVHYDTHRQHLFRADLPVAELQRAVMVYLGNLPETPISEKKQLLAVAKKHNAHIFLNFGVKDCRRPIEELLPLLEMADVIILNGHELADLIKAPYGDIHFKERVINWYAPFLREKLVVVTDGKNGSFVYEKDEVLFQKAIAPEKIIDTTGAGDAYAAGFISAFFKSKGKVRSAMQSGAMYACRILSRLGANEAT